MNENQSIEAMSDEAKRKEFGHVINIVHPSTHYKSIAYTVVENNSDNKSKLTLFEVQDVYYPHPDAPNDAFISRIELKEVLTANHGTLMYPPLALLKNSIDNMHEVLSRNGK